MNWKLGIASPILVLVLGACLENEEDIVVHEDGSVTVTVTAKGDPADMANGYPVPLGPGWRIEGEDTRRWLELVGADTGGAAVQARVGEVDWPSRGEGGDDDEIRLAVERTFPSAADLPEWYAPASEPYRTAFLRRTARLDVRTAGGRTVYVFQRVYHRRDRGPRDAFTQSGDRLPEDLRNRFENHGEISAEDWRTVTDVVRASFADAAEEFARDALVGIYTQGDASLPARALPAILREVRKAAAATVSTDTLVAMYESSFIRGEDQDVVEGGEDEGGRLLRGMEEAMRASIRSTLGEALTREEVAETTRNAILFGLEWGFTAYAHSDDIRDEKFTVRLELPGVVVSGNFDEADGGTARWSFGGDRLQDRDVVLRAVSVLE